MKISLLSGMPGNYPSKIENWTLDHLKSKHPSIPYNPLIANTFFRSGYIESWGRGIEKIHRECLEWGIVEPGYDYSMTGLMLSFEANSEQAKEVERETPVKTPVKTPERILAVLADTPDVSLSELAYIIEKSDRAVERAVAKLVAAGKLRHVGPKKADAGKSCPLTTTRKRRLSECLPRRRG